MSSSASPGSGRGLSHAESHAALSDAPFRIAAISLAVTACLLALKLTLGMISESIAVLSDAVDSGTDVAGGAAALISVRIARQPADPGHPFGHGKIEAVSASVAATIIGVGGGIITYQAVRRLIEGSPDINVEVGLAAMVITALANIVMSYFMRREARSSGSLALRAEATHLQTNVVQACGIIGGLLLVWVTEEPMFDPIIALVLAAYLGWTAIGLVRTALSEIMDASLPDDEQQIILAVLDEHSHEIRGFHRLRTRRSGSTRQIDMHLLFEAGRTVEDVHSVADNISDEIHARLEGSLVVIHTEPEGADASNEREPTAGYSEPG